MQENNFLGQNQTVITGELVNITRYNIVDRGIKGGSIFLSLPNTDFNPDVLGLQLVKLPMPYEMFDQQQAKIKDGAYTLPCPFEIVMELRMGAQNKMTQFVKAMRPLLPESSVNDTPTVKPDAAALKPGVASPTAAKP